MESLVWESILGTLPFDEIALKFLLLASRMPAIRELPVVPICRRRAPLPRRANRNDLSRRPGLVHEGRFAIVTNVGPGMRWTSYHQARLRADD
jgi:hypothetical protein